MNLIDMQNIWTINEQASLWGTEDSNPSNRHRCDEEETVRSLYIRKTHLPPAAASQMIKDTSGNHNLFVDTVNIQ